MQTHEAEDIAHRLATSWPRSNVAVEAWIEQLADLDRPRADQAMRNLVRTSEHAPSIAQFFAVYRGLLGSAHNQSTGPECEHCQDTGWVTCTDHPNHRGHWHGIEDRQPVSIINGKPEPDDCICNIVRPCRCRLGERTAASWYGKQGAAA